jgi:putative iron-only hydrogenase system regulator
MSDTEKTRVAMLSIIVSDEESVEQINALLHDFGEYIVGRLGIPYRKRGINIIGIVLDAPQDAISTLSGKVGRLSGVSAKVTYSSV